MNAVTVQRVLYQASDSSKQLDGVAVVSAIIAAEDPKKASEELLRLIKSHPRLPEYPCRIPRRNMIPKVLLPKFPAS